jgi:cell division protein FtsQ
MKKMVKKILISTAAVVCCMAVVGGGVWCSVVCKSSPCTQVCIVVKDSVKRQFVDAFELEHYLKRNACYPQGDSMRMVDCYAIEQCLLRHDMVRKAECYKSPFGKVSIAVSQRVPVLAVVSNNGCYYVDSDRRVMPIRGELDHRLHVLKGAVTERAAREEYFDFVGWLRDNSYWGERICAIHVQTPKHLVLTQEGLDAKIILGELDGYEAKLTKLRKLYTKGFDEIGYPDYREYDLRYAKQVVGRK